ncbi:hypothetical protein BATDEDRAFT_34915 [Batrachochytrium dendrobatidis JAM81]|uniref:NADH dehydrogenase [ubiquinone] 1 beta subcomplex subunit 8, mitochondrial n=2 Tax=Batrachochytrium dendrobatidis TaxID=109871 RepID=F4P0Y9_BATDJ|nr:uncharacterized protein BATDEDRAFT_34915 [Batrachochytrium dendrobatidis JAM81]EGF81675.1 hypothetical protein BATDEDRAFT_34915 [Batrachochytrium dendrobatidis JAM81]KAK5669430.1 hypothetical protein QVD99_003825 [Batrachochytrium dendrobatidis]OAJ37959.1 hypothetical protein BDEG_21928 [Batrachochytrium dendrobatidis JEL423]|eukprot:XP_006678040.1 hypothetical protein BATDEDRAFT_34915 [Batrachochytrium dendrobatidis JAM81]
MNRTTTLLTAGSVRSCLFKLGLRSSPALGLSAFRAIQSARSSSSNSLNVGKGSSLKRPEQDILRPIPHQEWTNRYIPTPTAAKLEIDEKDLFQHPQYTPPPKVSTSIGPLVGPLHMPEFDQSKQMWTETGVRSWDSLADFRFENAKDSLIGDYPRIEPQFAWIRDPYSYWDQQGRRNFGEVLYDNDQFTDAWGIGPASDWWQPTVTAAVIFGFIGILVSMAYLWDTDSHLWFAEKDYPFNGLRIELGGDPEDESDNWMAAHVYKV